MEKLNKGRLKRLLETFLISKKIDIINQNKKRNTNGKLQPRKQSRECTRENRKS